MGTETIPDRKSNQRPQKSWLNNFRDVLCQTLVGRYLTGAPKSNYGRLGSSNYKFKNLYLFLGYVNIGDIVAFMDYAGSVALPQGWMLCDGSLVNQTNYDAQHSAGDWALYVVSSSLSAKYVPNMNNVYPGLTDGAFMSASPITSSGSNVLNMSHNHNATTGARADTSSNRPAVGTTTYIEDGAAHTHNLTMDVALSSSQNVEPENYSVKYIVRIV